MKSFLLFILMSLCVNAQILRLGTNSAELSELDSEVFESGIMYGVGYDFSLIGQTFDIEVNYVTNNYFDANKSEHSYLQIPFSTRFYLNPKIFARFGAQYDKALSGKLFGEDIKNSLNDGFSITSGLGFQLDFSAGHQILIEARYIIPQYNYLNLDENDPFGSLTQFHILFGFKL